MTKIHNANGILINADTQLSCAITFEDTHKLSTSVPHNKQLTRGHILDEHNCSPIINSVKT